jgi:hypothetical protein
MKIHLIRDKGFKEVIYNEVFEILNNSTGELKFEKWDNELDIISPKSHQDYFNVCNSFREENKLKNDVVLFLSSTSFDNYFSLPDFSNNIYVKVSGWENFVESQIRFPIAIEIVTNIFHLLMFDSLEDLKKKTHLHENRGCINDYTLNLKDVNLKMKTPDLCDDCLSLLSNNTISPNIVEQIFVIAEQASIELRKVKRYLASFDTVKLEIIERHTKLYFQSPINHAVKLEPVEFAFYKYLLQNESGVKPKDFQNYEGVSHFERQELNKIIDVVFEIYQSIYGVDRNTIKNLFTNELMTVKSNINKKLKNSLPKKIYKSWEIVNENGTYKLKIDRDLLTQH